MAKNKYRITFTRIGHRLQPCQTIFEANNLDDARAKFFAYFSKLKYELKKIDLIPSPFDASNY